MTAKCDAGRASWRSWGTRSNASGLSCIGRRAQTNSGADLSLQWQTAAAGRRCSVQCRARTWAFIGPRQNAFRYAAPSSNYGQTNPSADHSAPLRPNTAQARKAPLPAVRKCRHAAIRLAQSSPGDDARGPKSRPAGNAAAMPVDDHICAGPSAKMPQRRPTRAAVRGGLESAPSRSLSADSPCLSTPSSAPPATINSIGC
ncbi:hypothetical protein FHY33_002753 [Xanthomonas arboricola]|nr:hypothetical protein [Xanthomonas campestris]